MGFIYQLKSLSLTVFIFLTIMTQTYFNFFHYKHKGYVCLTIRFALVDILLHLEVNVGGSQVGATSQELLYIILLQSEGLQTSGHCRLIGKLR